MQKESLLFFSLSGGSTLFKIPRFCSNDFGLCKMFHTFVGKNGKNIKNKNAKER
jgi:hypothetical protein